MSLNNMKIKSKMLIFFIGTIVALMTVVVVLNSRLTINAITDNLNPLQQVIGDIAANAVTAGLELEDKDEVASALSEFKRQELFSYIQVEDKAGNEVFYYRKSGLPEFRQQGRNDMAELKDEMFEEMPIESRGYRIGTITIGISLTEQAKSLASTRISLVILSVVMIAVFSVITILIANKISKPIQEITAIAERLEQGDLNQEISIRGEDEIGKLAGSFRKMIEALKGKAEAAQQIAKGAVDVDVKKLSETDVLGQAMVEMKDALQAKAQAANQIAEGNLEAEIKVASEQDVLGNAMVSMVTNLKKGREEMESAMAKVDANMNVAQAVAEEVNRVAELLMDGKLSERAHAGDADGVFRKLVEGFNAAIDNIMKPVDEAVGCLSEMAKGNLVVEVTGDYKGDHAKMKDAVNTTLAALNDILGQVSVTVERVASGSQQVSSSSQSLSEGSTEQASSLEEITSSMTEMGAQTKQNAENATQANQLSSGSRDSADHGNKQMKQMLNAMGDIDEASGNISKIIKVIDGIAFQTNLLALNAAVEAARAGVHGKGFAVVAEEVRNLAQRSAKAAQETTELIEGSVKKVENGTEIAKKTAKALNEIVDGVTKVTDLVAAIASASNEQAQGIEQVSQSLMQVDQVTQSNTANAEESAAASEELSSQAAHLKQMLTNFELKGQDVGLSSIEYNSSKVTVVNDKAEHTEVNRLRQM